MRTITTKVGKVYYKDGIFTLEKHFSDLDILMAEEESVKERIKLCDFDVIDSCWIMEDNPFYDIEKLIKKETSKIRFIYKLKLEYSK